MDKKQYYFIGLLVIIALAVYLPNSGLFSTTTSSRTCDNWLSNEMSKSTITSSGLPFDWSPSSTDKRCVLDLAPYVTSVSTGCKITYASGLCSGVDTTICVPNFQCTAWTSCVNGKQMRTCSDLNGCQVSTLPTEQTCTTNAPVGTTNPGTVNNGTNSQTTNTMNASAECIPDRTQCISSSTYEVCLANSRWSGILTCGQNTECKTNSCQSTSSYQNTYVNDNSPNTNALDLDIGYGIKLWMLLVGVGVILLILILK